ncbi:MAG: HAMP domain-containing sensor histidine kinase, partial [Cyanobacteria bacterium J06631_9]
AGHQVDISGSDTVVVRSDPGSISQIITNLLTNSLTHAYLDGKPGKISISIGTQGNDVVLTYQDDGCGIPLENQSRIFEPFFTTMRNRGGSGLGLHLVYNIVTQTLCGEIQVDSRLDHGTTFTITFPISCTTC